MASPLEQADPEVWQTIVDERRRQSEGLELIASENYTSAAVLEAAGTVLTNKYAEGYPARRYYGGCEHVDVVEQLARERACRLFGAEHANVQPHAGSQANMSVYLTVLTPGDTFMAMDLAHGGSKVAVSIGNQRLQFTMQDTGHFQNFKPRTIGTVELAAGLHTLQIRPEKKAKNAVMDVRRVILSPAD